MHCIGTCYLFFQSTLLHVVVANYNHRSLMHMQDTTTSISIWRCDSKEYWNDTHCFAS